MKKLFPIILVFLLLIVSVGIQAMDTEKIVGEVLYHQNFNDVSDIAESGVHIGTASSANSLVGCEAEALEIHTYDSGRVYILLPEADKGDGDSYTIEFTFRFTAVHSDNGYIAPILTCRGLEPNNITSVIIRADGTIDNFSEPDAALKEAIAAGDTIHVRIPVESGVAHEIFLTAGDAEYTIERDNVLMVNSGSMGFVVRNADAAIDEVYIVHGTDYETKSGYYADQSYAADYSPVTVPESSVVPADDELSPATGDNITLLIILPILAAAGFVCAFFLGKRSR